MLTWRQKNELEFILLREKSELSNSVVSATRNFLNELRDFVPLFSNSDDDVPLVSTRSNTRASKQISHIDAALLRIKNGEYGICSKCNKSISFERLKLVPTTTFCSVCKKQKEQLSKRNRMVYRDEVHCVAGGVVV